MVLDKTRNFHGFTDKYGNIRGLLLKYGIYNRPRTDLTDFSRPIMSVDPYMFRDMRESSSSSQTSGNYFIDGQTLIDGQTHTTHGKNPPILKQIDGS